MYNFILKGRPLSYNSCKGVKRTNYKVALEDSFRNFYSTHSIFSNDIYAIIYYFYKIDLKLDADNISKPAWDCLGGFLFEDDNQIKIRTAGNFNLSSSSYSVLDLTGLSGKIIIDLLDAFDNEDHIVYIECVVFNNNMFRFNIE